MTIQTNCGRKTHHSSTKTQRRTRSTRIAAGNLQHNTIKERSENLKAYQLQQEFMALLEQQKTFNNRGEVKIRKHINCHQNSPHT
jgi:hypothetical protein